MWSVLRKLSGLISATFGRQLVFLAKFYLHWFASFCQARCNQQRLPFPPGSPATLSPPPGFRSVALRPTLSSGLPLRACLFFLDRINRIFWIILFPSFVWKLGKPNPPDGGNLKHLPLILLLLYTKRLYTSVFFKYVCVFPCDLMAN